VQVLNYDLLVLSSGLQDVASTRLAKLDYKVRLTLEYHQLTKAMQLALSTRVDCGESYVVTHANFFICFWLQQEGKMELPLGVYPPSRPHLCKVQPPRSMGRQSRCKAAMSTYI
jgi:hypothetical protein